MKQFRLKKFNNYFLFLEVMKHNILDDNMTDAPKQSISLGIVIMLHFLQISVLIGIAFLFNYLDNIPAIHSYNGWLGVSFALILILSNTLMLHFRIGLAWNSAISTALAIFVLELFLIAFVGRWGLWVTIATYSIFNTAIIELLEPLDDHES